MKTKISILLTLLVGFWLKDTQAQSSMIKLGGFFFTNLESASYLGLDVGFEYKLNNHFSVQLSASGSGYKSNLDNFRSNNVYSLQSRYYFYGDKWRKSTFAGLVLQRQRKVIYEYTDNYMEKVFISDQKNLNKTGLGIIIGQHLQIVDIIGLDFHVGELIQVGKETHITREHGNTPTTTTVRHNLWNLRPFWGVNMYFALGKMK